MLHITANPLSSSQSSSQENYKFITPAEEIVKTDASKAKHDRVEDYFKTPDLIPVELPAEVQTKNTNTASLSELENKSKQDAANSISRSRSLEQPALKSNNLNTALFGEISQPESNSHETEQFTIQKSIDMIRKLVEELNSHGVKADLDEMNFSKSYQIIIKLDKTAE